MTRRTRVFSLRHLSGLLLHEPRLPGERCSGRNSGDIRIAHACMEFLGMGLDIEPLSVLRHVAGQSTTHPFSRVLTSAPRPNPESKGAVVTSPGCEGILESAFHVLSSLSPCFALL